MESPHKPQKPTCVCVCVCVCDTPKIIIRNVSSNQYIRMISEGSCDTEDWNNDVENSTLHICILYVYIQYIYIYIYIYYYRTFHVIIVTFYHLFTTFLIHNYLLFNKENIYIILI